jgi:hypothetical protein
VGGRLFQGLAASPPQKERAQDPGGKASAAEDPKSRNRTRRKTHTTRPLEATGFFSAEMKQKAEAPAEQISAFLESSETNRVLKKSMHCRLLKNAQMQGARNPEE